MYVFIRNYLVTQMYVPVQLYNTNMDIRSRKDKVKGTVSCNRNPWNYLQRFAYLHIAYARNFAEKKNIDKEY